jgi:hypothetical protein
MHTANDIRVNSWEELNQALFKDAWSDKLERFRSPFAFRGLSNANYNLQTSLIRLGGAYHKLEPVILRSFQKYAYRDTSPGNSIWNWLAVAQHHGLPTRLLDWSSSPHIALHFATAEVSRFGDDGVVWCLNAVRLREWMPDRMRQVLENESAIMFTVDMLSRIASSLPEFDHLQPEPFLIMMEPPSMDDRIVNQAALFSLMSSPSAVMNEWLADKPELFHRIVIPAALKWEVRDKLDMMNMNERLLFPGLDGLSQYLKRYYSPRINDDRPKPDA